MRIFAIDTSFEACSIALIDEDRVLWDERRIIGKGHSEILPVMTAAAFSKTGTRVGDIDRIGVVIGPGAFAGVRVGLAFARGLRLGGSARVVGVTSLAALAASLEETGPVAPVFDARRGQVYAGLFDAGRAELVAPFVATPEEAARRIGARGDALTLAGSGAALVAPYLGGGVAISNTLHIEPVAVARRAAAAIAPAEAPSPLYLRPPDAEPSSGGPFDRLFAS